MKIIVYIMFFAFAFSEVVAQTPIEKTPYDKNVDISKYDAPGSTLSVKGITRVNSILDVNYFNDYGTSYGMGDLFKITSDGFNHKGYGIKMNSSLLQVERYSKDSIYVVPGKVTLNMKEQKTEIDGGTIKTNLFKTKKLSVNANIWADYVFSDGYKRMPLENVESYIQENGHLPGIPSENEVRENGVDVIGMQAKLLEKIEELTLHIIDMEEEIKTLELSAR